MRAGLRGGLALTGVVVVAMAAAPLASAFIYWGDLGGTTISRANNDGTGVLRQFVTGANGNVKDVAVDGGHIYWVVYAGHTIGRANLNGSGADSKFITLPGGFNATALAVGAGHIFWGGSTIGRANLDGTGVNPSFIAPGGGACALAVHGSYVYWIFYKFAEGTVWRANVDGTGARSLINSGGFACGGAQGGGVAVDDSSIYWGNPNIQAIGRANLDGSGANPRLINALPRYYTPCGMAVGGAHIYWGGYDQHSISRATLDGSGGNQSFISNVGGVCGVAVDAGGTGGAVPPPVQGKAVDVGTVSGTVLVKMPGQTGFQPLTGSEQIPVGSTIDTTQGKARLTSAAGTHGRVQAATFYEGAFVVGQRRGRAMTTLRLTGGDFRSCRRHAPDVGPVAQPASRHPRRHLWGSGHGSFGTTGNSASATVRGTIWLTEDDCEGTLIRVKRGVVTVKDLVRHKTIIVHTAQSYFAHR